MNGNLLECKKIVQIRPRRSYPQPHSRHVKNQWISDSETKGGGVNDIGFESDSDSHSDKYIPPKRKSVKTQTDEVDAEWAEEFFPPIESIELNSLRIVSVLPRDIQAPYYKNNNDRPTNLTKTKKTFFSCISSQTQVKVLRFYPNFRGEGIQLPDIPYVRSQDWTNDWSNESDSEERDSEWIISSIPLENTPSFDEIKEGDNCCADEVHNSWKLYINIMRCLGRWPFHRQINSEGFKEFVVKKSSFEFLTFVLTSCTYFFILLLNFISLFTFLLGNSSTTDHEITTLEFDKYWPYLFWNICLGLFIFYWNILLTFNGIFMLQYMNRFSKSVERMKYVPTDGIRISIWWWLTSFTLYATILSILFAIKFEPVYYGSGLTATFIFSNIWTGVRFSYYYPTLRVIGFIYHLFLFFNFNSIIVHIGIYVKFLENMASRWNIRFAYRFKIIARDKLEFYASSSEKTTISSYASLKIETLLQENRIIASLSRHISFVFRNSFNAYIFISGWMISIFLYRATTYILTTADTEEAFVKKQIPGVIGETGDELYYEDDDFSRTLTLIILCCFLSVSWFLNSRTIASCGESIMSGFKLVQRYGLIRCKDEDERLMIKSLTFQYGPTLNYYLDFGFKFDKAAIFNLSAYIVLFGFGLLSFAPFNMSKQAITACIPDEFSENVVCKTIHVARVARAGKQPLGLIKNQISELSNSSVTKDHFSEITNLSVIEDGSNHSDIFRRKNSKPKDKPHEKNYCIPMFNGVLLKNPERIPQACDEEGNIFKPYGNNNDKDCWDKLPELDEEITAYSQKSGIQLYYCDEKGVENKRGLDADDCGNRRTIKYKIGTQEPLKMINVLVNINGKLYQMCCWDYGLSPESLSRCNMKNSELAQKTCLYGSRGGGSGIIYTQGDKRFGCDHDQWKNVIVHVPNHNCSGVYHMAGCHGYGGYYSQFPGGFSVCSIKVSDGWPYSYTYKKNNELTWIYRCKGSIIPLHEQYRDDCGNIPYFTKTIKKSVMLSFNESNEYFCCFDYLESGAQENDFVQLPNSLAVCHISNPDRRKIICKNGSSTPKKC